MKDSPQIDKEIRIISKEEYDNLQAKEKELKETIELLQRTRADYLNYIKMAKKQQEEIKEYALEEFFKKLIPWLLLLDSALIFCKNSSDTKSIAEGVELLIKELKKILSTEGLEEIEPLNQEYDPFVAEVVEAVDTNLKEEDNKVCEVVQKGYKLKGRVLSAAKVKIKKFKEALATENITESSQQNS